MNFHSFKFRIMAYLLSVVILVIISVSATSFIITYNTLDTEINEKMPLKVETVIDQINDQLTAHSSLVKSAASLAQSNRGNMSRTGYVEFLKNTVQDNSSSFGFGIWFEPYVFSSSYRFFGPYVYKDSGKIVFTTDYETAKYNFHSQEWYLNGKKVKENQIAWSVPFYDEATDVTMVSAVSPIVGPSGEFQGVASGDYDVSEIQRIVSDIKDEKTGLFAFLMLKDGTFLSWPEKKYVMKKKITEHPMKSLAEAGKTVLEKGKGETEYENSEGTQRLYFQSLGETGWIICISVSESMLFAPLKKMGTAVLIVIILAFAVSIIISLFISGRISNPVRKMNEFASLLAKGDFTQRVEISQKDEIGMLADALNSSADNLEELISGIISSAQNLSQAVDEISKGNMNLSQRTTEQASALEEIAATIEENTATVDRNAENSREAQNLTDQGAGISSEGREQASVAIDSINDINESSKKISEIITVINEIAFQTNLLALNAAVEAARAGEQGRGFAVVAGEVRNLAQRSGEAAKEIKQLIFESVEKVENGTELVIKTGEFLKEIADAAKTSAGLIGEIAAASDEQKSGMDQINRAVIELDSMTQQNASLVEQTAAASEEMTNQARELLTLMDRFAIRSKSGHKPSAGTSISGKDNESALSKTETYTISAEKDITEKEGSRSENPFFEGQGFEEF